MQRLVCLCLVLLFRKALRSGAGHGHRFPGQGTAATASTGRPLLLLPCSQGADGHAAYEGGCIAAT